MTPRHRPHNTSGDRDRSDAGAGTEVGAVGERREAG